MRAKKLLLTSIASVAVGSVMADLAFTNGDFEAQPLASNANNRNIADWYEMTANPAWDDFVWAHDTWLPGSGSYGTVGMIGNGYIYQSLGTITDEATLQIAGTAIRRDGHTFAGLTVEAFAGAFAAADYGTDVGAAGLTSLGTYLVDNTGLEGVGWQGDPAAKGFTASFDLSGQSAGTEVWIRLSATSPGSSITATVDNLSVIPEPGTLGLVTAFGGGILFIRRRLML